MEGGGGGRGVIGLNVTDVRMERIPLLWSTVKERAWAKGFSLNTGDTKYLCVSRRTKLPGRGVDSEKVRETGSQEEVGRERFQNMNGLKRGSGLISEVVLYCWHGHKLTSGTACREVCLKNDHSQKTKTKTKNQSRQRLRRNVKGLGLAVT